jgi:hypothetical protein
MFFDAFKRNSFAKVESFYLEQSHGEVFKNYSWLALAINQRSISGSLLTKELVLTPRDSKMTPGISIQLAELENGLTQHIFQGPKKIYSANMTDFDELKNSRTLFNNFLDTLIQNEIKIFSEQMNQSQFSPRQLENEEKALEWVRVSFEMLTKAILESLTNPEFLFQTTFFSGINPKTGKHELRLITFNLDMTFYLLDDLNLRVMIYNKKPGDKDSELKPALMGDYSFRKREIFDQFINLLSVVSKGMHA